ncbi:hypothetical protein [Actinomadura rubrisoli]|uniref:Uncharacterized protein n=1 Tax=Actinomadura rubrisoli TaxID=2530368 RepID=A0A4R5AHC5_9ACTN|nr:hypothetical protein [Actinomadura rubrisoli]TDD70840.1 hypothetical protein E1298_36390 [Actinomadura rubrisoli]
MSQPRPATVVGTIALVLVGGAVATVVGAILMFIRFHPSSMLDEGIRDSTAYYALACAIIGFITAVFLMPTRPRGPAAPITAVIAGYVALNIGVRCGVILDAVTYGTSFDIDFILTVLDPGFSPWDLLAPAVAGTVAGVRVAMVAGKPAQPLGGFGVAPQPPFSGRPMQPPGPGYQPPTPTYRPQPPTPGGPQGPPPPSSGGPGRLAG